MEGCKLKINKKCVIFCTHFDSAGPESRVKGAQLLMQQQKQIAPDLPVIIAGDFNLMITHPTLTDIIKKTEDTYELLTKNATLFDIRDFTGCSHYGPDGTWIGWPYDKHAAPLGTVGERLDHMFVRKCHVLREGVLNIKVNRSLHSLAVYPSDHLPIIADITLQ